MCSYAWKCMEATHSFLYLFLLGLLSWPSLWRHDEHWSQSIKYLVIMFLLENWLTLILMAFDRPSATMQVAFTLYCHSLILHSSTIVDSIQTLYRMSPCMRSKCIFWCPSQNRQISTPFHARSRKFGWRENLLSICVRSRKRVIELAT